MNKKITNGQDKAASQWNSLNVSGSSFKSHFMPTRKRCALGQWCWISGNHLQIENRIKKKYTSMDKKTNKLTLISRFRKTLDWQLKMQLKTHQLQDKTMVVIYHNLLDQQYPLVVVVVNEIYFKLKKDAHHNPTETGLSSTKTLAE